MPDQLHAGPVRTTSSAVEGPAARGRGSAPTAVLDRLELTWDDLDTDPAPLVVSLTSPPSRRPAPARRAPVRPSADEAWVLGVPVAPWPIRAVARLGEHLSSWSNDRGGASSGPFPSTEPRWFGPRAAGARPSPPSTAPRTRRWAGAGLLVVGLLLVVVGAVRWLSVRADGGPAAAPPTTASAGPALLPPATTAPAPAATAPPSSLPDAADPESPSLPPAPTVPAGPAIEAGESFSHPCAVDPATTPVRTVDSVTMQMACLGLPLEIPVVQVIYGDPGLDPAAFSGTITVTGEVVEVERSPTGILVPIVVADRIIF